jgi:hypothetical protein
MANSFAGEKEIILGGKKYFLKMNFLAQAEAENRLQVGIWAIAQRIMRKIFGIQDLAAVIYGGILGYYGNQKDPPLSYEEVGDLIIIEGQVKFVPIVSDLLTFATTGKWEAEHQKEKTQKKKSQSDELKITGPIN